MKKIACLLASIYFGFGQAAIADQFQKVQCGADIPKALIGQRSSNERIVTLEERNRKLGLKHLGADEVLAIHQHDVFGTADQPVNRRQLIGGFTSPEMLQAQ